VAVANDLPFLMRHEFLIRRLHSLSGLIPVGAYMTVHLLTNATVLDSPGTFQNNVHRIHSLGPALLAVEWAFIFLPILFHGLLGIAIIRSGIPNTTNYPYAGNVRYTLQRASGIVALVFIVWHVFHMHGWFHSDWWLANVANPLAGAQFKPFNAASTAAEAVQQSIVVQIVYAAGVVACVFHFANGLWTIGITWGLWTSAAAQRRAGNLCAAAGLFLTVVGLSALWGLKQVDVEQARDVEDRIYHGKVDSGAIAPNEHKRFSSEHLE